MVSNSNDNDDSKSKTKWITVGKLWKNKYRPDRLRGHIEIEGVKFEVHAFINTPVKKKFGDEEDIRISMIVEDISEEENPFIDNK